MDTKECIKCNTTKEPAKFPKARNVCNDCTNAVRRDRYKNEPERRAKQAAAKSAYKKQKKEERHAIKAEEAAKLAEKIGTENAICKYCDKVVPKIMFRYNRLKCKECERKHGRKYRQTDVGRAKAKTWINTNRERMTELQRLWAKDARINNEQYRIKHDSRSKIKYAIIHKSNNSFDLLGCDIGNYFHWIFHNTEPNYTMENYGQVWQIDHVIPLSRFDLTDEDQLELAFNWRNTTPVSADENAKKRARLDIDFIKNHWERLSNYHKEYEIEMSEEIEELYAKHLDDRESP